MRVTGNMVFGVRSLLRSIATILWKVEENQMDVGSLLFQVMPPQFVQHFCNTSIFPAVVVIIDIPGGTFLHLFNLALFLLCFCKDPTQQLHTPAEVERA